MEFALLHDTMRYIVCKVDKAVAVSVTVAVALCFHWVARAGVGVVLIPLE